MMMMRQPVAKKRACGGGEDGDGELGRLPEEVIVRHILSRLGGADDNGKSLGRCVLVSKRMASLVALTPSISISIKPPPPPPTTSKKKKKRKLQSNNYYRLLLKNNKVTVPKVVGRLAEISPTMIDQYVLFIDFRPCFTVEELERHRIKDKYLSYYRSVIQSCNLKKKTTMEEIKYVSYQLSHESKTFKVEKELDKNLDVYMDTVQRRLSNLRALETIIVNLPQLDLPLIFRKEFSPYPMKWKFEYGGGGGGVFKSCSALVGDYFHSVRRCLTMGRRFPRIFTEYITGGNDAPVIRYIKWCIENAWILFPMVEQMVRDHETSSDISVQSPSMMARLHMGKDEVAKMRRQQSSTSSTSTSLKMKMKIKVWYLPFLKVPNYVLQGAIFFAAVANNTTTNQDDTKININEDEELMMKEEIDSFFDDLGGSRRHTTTAPQHGDYYEDDYEDSIDAASMQMRKTVKEMPCTAVVDTVWQWPSP